MKKGDTVHWKWGRSEAEGAIEKKFGQDTAIRAKGKQIKRKANAEEPAYEIVQDDGTKVLKSESELKKGKK